MNNPVYEQEVDWLLDLVFPIRCIGCGRFSKNSAKQYVCSVCLHTITLNRGSECIGCKRATPLGVTCLFCAPENPVDQLLIVADYNDPLVVAMLKTFKYRFVPAILEPITELVGKYFKQLAGKGFSPVTQGVVVVPVPLARHRENWRGFNQSALIADRLAQSLLLPYAPEVLVRVQRGKPQADMVSRQARLENIINYFRCNSMGITGQTILLVDDVCTTGATLNECARVIKSAGAKKVIALVVARG